MCEHASQRQRGHFTYELHFNGRRVGSLIDRFAPTACRRIGNKQLVSTDGGKIRDEKHHCAQTV
jgi:hypothetical protein